MGKRGGQVLARGGSSDWLNLWALLIAYLPRCISTMTPAPAGAPPAPPSLFTPLSNEPWLPLAPYLSLSLSPPLLPPVSPSRPSTILLLPETFTPGKWLADIAGLRVRLECREDGGRIGFKEAVATEIYWKTIGSCKRIFITRPRWTLANGALLGLELGAVYRC